MRCSLMRGRTWSVPFAVLLSAVCWSGRAGAQTDELEKSSVIPIAKAAQEREQPIGAEVLSGGDSSRRTRDRAISQLPLDLLSPEDRQQVQRLLKDLSLFRRLPTVELDADSRAYQFFACNPDVAVSIWRVMQISNVEMWQTGPNDYETDTNDGTQGRVEVLQRSPEGYLILCRGVLQSPALPNAIRADALMHLQPRYPSPGKVVHHVDLFVCFPSQTVETIARLISPVSYRIADRNFEEISLFIEMMSGAMARQPGWVEQIAGQLDGVIAQRPQELLDVTAKIYVDAQKQRLIERGEPVTLEAIRPPISQQASSPEAAPIR